MTERRAKVWIYAKEFKNEVSESNFKLIEEEICELKDGEFLARALYLSVDPYQRTFQLQFPAGSSLMIGRQVAE